MFMQGWMKNSAVTNLLSSPGMKLPNTLFDRGASWQNMGGIENSLDGGLYHFKSKFNPVIEEFVGEFNLPTSLLYPLVNKVYKNPEKIKGVK